MQALLNQHEKIALQFSGGRDSLALLLLLRPFWEKLTVYYCDTGDTYPETQDLIRAFEKILPHFVRVQDNSEAVRKERGWPSDILHAEAGWSSLYQHKLRLQDRHSCCFYSMMKPLHDRMKADGITLIIRGQREQDDPKSPVEDGATIDGVTFSYPLKTWSVADVERFILASGMDVPQFYREGMTSAPDCLHCTAWLEHGAISYLKKHHQNTHFLVKGRLQQIGKAVQHSLEQLTNALEI